MTIDSRLIVVFWLIFMVYWAVMAVGVKRNLDARVWWRESGVRVGALVLVVLALHVPAVRHALGNARADAYRPGTLPGLTGVALCACGLGLAVWARVNLGRNWGMPMSRKEHPELVTRGPYSYVRHPIYTGMLMAMLGSAIGESAFWSIPLVVFAVYFVYGARREEQLMIELFPDQYPAYRKRTKMLVPFVL